MAKFVADAGNGGNMLHAFMWPTYGIASITPVGGGTWEVKSPGTASLDIYYNSTGTLTGTGNIPTAGSFDEMTLYFDGVQQGFFSQISRADNFKEIDDAARFRILDGNDLLTGAINKADVLFGGFGGSDNFQGRSGGDEYIVATLANKQPTHVITGSPTDTDTLTIWQNIYEAGGHTLDLTRATIFEIDRLKLDPGVTVLLATEQFDSQVISPNAAIEGGAGSVVMVTAPGAGTLDFSGVALSGGVRLVLVASAAGNQLIGSAGTDTLVGHAASDILSAGAGADILRGGLAPDVMTGGPGGDAFDFNAVPEIGKKKGLLDLITDWGDGDRIDLSSIDANGSKKGDKAWKFLKKEGADFTKAGQVGFDQKKALTYVQGDTNGDGKADFKLELAGKIDFAKADFVL